ncbi:hypothetical protein [Aestuariicoccus sp. MJ-SS9]|uniref:GFA family protein n=1 Tax=Aestuariicoccus sp. MJ-SS9 TaxID=3079855 RepID=UPI0029091E1B|nr:hypothetical protein [Aestuariicoccus sp. MJ-SS9]MDU8912325.1 hypothetical protein [Aestuariicoccus sp. MJ-SS9]
MDDYRDIATKAGKARTMIDASKERATGVLAQEIFAGGCTCGHLGYRISSKPLIVHGCHSTLCQKQSG